MMLSLLSKSQNRRIQIFWIPILLFALNFGIRFAKIDTIQIGMDEPFTLFYAQMPVSEILDALAQGNNPPMMELLLHGWTQIFGTSVVAVRLPSLLFSCLSAPFIFWIGRRVYDWHAGLFASLIFSFATLPIYFSHEARVYSLFALLSLISVYELLRFRENHLSFLHLVAFTFANILLIYSHYFGFIVIAWEILWILVFPHDEKRKILLRFALAMLVTGLAFLPQLQILLTRYGDASGTHWVAQSSFPGLYHILAKYLNQPVTTVISLFVILVAGLKWLYLRMKGRANFKDDLFLILAIFPGAYLLLWLIGWKIPVFLDRYTVFSMMGLYILIGISVSFLFKANWQKAIAAFGIVLVFAFSCNLALNPRSEWKEVAEKFKALKQSEDVIFLSPWWNKLAFLYHYDHSIFEDYQNLDTRMNAAGIFGVMQATPLSKLNLNLPTAIWIATVGEIQVPLHPSLEDYVQRNYNPAPAIEGNHGIILTGYLRKTAVFPIPNQSSLTEMPKY